MFVEGHIVDFLDSEQLRLAYVRKQEHDRLHLIDPRGRNLSISSDRVIIVYRPVAESEFPAVARQISDAIAARQSEVDLELLWQSVDANQRELGAAELAELFFANRAPEQSAAIFRALSEDNLFFKRKGAQFIPKTAEQVSTEMTRRQRQQEREQFRERASTAIRQLLKNTHPAAAADAEPILDRIQNWLKYKTGDEVGTILEELSGPAKAREAAYDILLRAGRIDRSVDRFLITAGVEPAFSPQVVEVAERLPSYVHQPNRVDYQNVPAITIDDDDTREVDDALTVELSGGEILVGIHIADVSTFVRKGDVLDTDAARRSSTIYLPNVSVRMFPEKLSTDLVSLNPEGPRPAFTVEVRFDEQGNRLGYRIHLTTIRVAKRLSYDEADAAIEAGDSTLQTLHRLAKLLQEARANRGAITFRRPELKIRVRADEIEVKQLDPNSASRFLVSEMMILANGLAADFASANVLPVIYRTQEPREALAIDDTPMIEALAFERLRKTFKRSRLSLTPSQHSGLGLTAYTQMSSPIRRYADLVTQRQFTAMLAGMPVPHSREELLQILATAESGEQDIRGIEDRSTHYWLLEYLSRHAKDTPLTAVVLDTKGNIELADYYLRAKLPAPGKLKPGETINVWIESIDPTKGEIRFKPNPGS
jgi:exoribonuclease II